MRDDNQLPLTRPVEVERLPQHGDDIRIEATADERAALAKDFNIPAIHELVGTFFVKGGAKRVRVEGKVTARVVQTCVVTLEPFESVIEEAVEVNFAQARKAMSPEEEERRRIDPPDEIVDGKLDLGALTAEFLALGLDPYPKKPGVAFAPAEEAAAPESPFAALGGLKSDGKDP